MPSPASLPEPNAEQYKISNRLVARVKNCIQQQDAITVHEFMQQALYAPGLGYYAAGSQKFGDSGDFITAPELSPLFGECVARQAIQVLQGLNHGSILEFGAGSGKLAASIIKTCSRLNNLPDNYFILEVSADLKTRQQDHLKKTCPEFFKNIIWLDALPKQFEGVILANEVLDAMPVHAFKIKHRQCFEIVVKEKEQQLILDLEKPTDGLNHWYESKKHLLPKDNYQSEVNLSIAPWLAAIDAMLHQGIILLIDYGYGFNEYYHPSRHMGTLTCHYRHYNHQDILLWPGLQDITAHVDFSAVAYSAHDLGLSVSGYTQQAYFLMDCGIHANTVSEAQAIKKLTLPHEMGELFKVIALSKQLDCDLIGFQSFDQRHALTIS